ncbi:MAG: caspase family protein [Rhizobiaceae bacterium]|nr:caspase family protein [Rhizobiaceae bacterium]
MSGVFARLVAAALLLSWAMPGPAPAADRTLKGVALVIGNGDYEHIPALPNPGNDARAIEEMLSDLGFETTAVLDRDARRLRRDLQSFVEDAEGADVAFLYYSGHGIEAGGENYLIPVDADLSALESAGEALAPLSAIIDELKATVPVAIVMLDACRDNPFPAGALVKADPAAPGVPIDASGLGESRGAAPLAAASTDASFGTVVGFAAEPGKAALDGPAGGNSPYAAAVLRHLSALTGEEFGTVMRMVAEEVYLKTDGRQRPWINESLRRLLYFGGTATEPAGEEGEILAERRQLLLTISSLPEAGRKRIETIADADGVPMDALFGMLKALGAEAPDDPAELDALLRGQTERLKALLAERDALKSSDPEIMRLASLADEALDEGALTTAIRLLDQAKERVGALRRTVDDAEADIRARRLEFAAVYAKSADARLVTFDYAAAAADYALAFEQAQKWDDRLAWSYKNSEAEALTFLGERQGDRDALLRSVAAAEVAVALAQTSGGGKSLTSSRIVHGNALQALGGAEADTATLEKAIAVYGEALAGLDRDTSPEDWATLQNNSGNVLTILARRAGDPARLGEAADAYRKALEVFERDGPRVSWLFAMNNLAKSLLERAEFETGVERLNEAAALFEQALDGASRAEYPVQWAIMQNNYANVLQTLGMRTADPQAGTALHLKAVEAYRNALLEWTPERAASHRAIAQNNLGNVYQSLAYREPGNAAAHLRAAEEQQTAAIEATSRAEQPLQWAAFVFNRGRTFHMQGDFAATEQEAVATYRKSVADFEAALGEMTLDRVPQQWVGARLSLANVLQAQSMREAEDAAATETLEEALAVFRGSLDQLDAARFPNERANTLLYLANAYVLLGDRGGGVDRYREAEGVYRELMTMRARQTSPVEWAYAAGGLGNALRAIGLMTHDRDTLTEARAITMEAWDTIRPFDSQFDPIVQQRIAEIDAALAKAD